MKILHRMIILSFIGLIGSTQSAFAARDFSNTVNVFKESQHAQAFFKNAFGYAVFPTVGEGAALIGGTYGKGQLYQGNKLAGDLTLFGLSIGPQVGGDAYSEIIFFKNKQAFDEFKEGKYAFNAKASVVAVSSSAQTESSTLGTYASANTQTDVGAYTASYDDGVAVLVRGKNGFMAKASVGGQHFSFQPLNTDSDKVT